MRVGIIGGGSISDTHARAAQAIDGLTIEAVYGANAARVGALAAERRRDRRTTTSSASWRTGSIS